MNSFVVNLVYLAAILLGFPYFLYKILATPKSRSSILARLGGGARRESDGPLMVIHGVSVGEVLAARTLFEGLVKALPGWEFIITSTTPTGYEMARKAYPDVAVGYFPLDISFAVNRFFGRLRPSGVILMELEIWPNFLSRAYREEIPVFLANGRISQGSFRGYQKVKRLLFKPLTKIRRYCVQTEEYARRFLDLDIPESQIAVTGSMKFDSAPRPINAEEEASIRESLHIPPTHPVFVAGSTHAGEESIVLSAFKELRKKHSSLLLVIVPRYPNRADEISDLVRQAGFTAARKSMLDEALGDRVLIVDTIGELARVYGIATCVFVGGSLVPRGGQNMIEPAALGRPVVFGPQIENFAEVGEMLVKSGAADYVHDARDMTSNLDPVLSDPERARQMGDRGKETVARLRGSTARTVDIICEVLNGKGGDSALPPGNEMSRKNG